MKLGDFWPFGGGKWIEGEGSNYDLPDLERMGREALRPRGRRALLLLGLLLLLSLLALPWFLTELWWFRSLDLQGVFLRRVLLKVLGFCLGTLVSLPFLWASLGSMPPRRRLMLALLPAALVGREGASLWLKLPVALAFEPLGVRDPLFGLDAGFYVFVLPALRGLVGLGWRTWFMGGILSLLRLRDRGISPQGLLALRGLSGALPILLAARMWLDLLGMVGFPGRVVYGASFAQARVALPISILNIALLLAMGIWIMAGRMSLRGLKLSAVALLALFAARGGLPPLVDQLVVRPNEFQLERPYIESHIRMTRRGYGIDSARTVQTDPTPHVTGEELRRGMGDVRLWDYEPLLRTYKQLQEIRSYYEFIQVDVDRYNLGGEQRQVMLSVRELDHRKLRSQTWVNRHLEFTHGYGLVMNLVNQVQPGGLPNLIVRDIPPASDLISISVPQVYFGEMDYPYALVRTKVKEFDYPSGDSNVRSTYQGSGGVPVGSPLRRLAFALRLKDLEILFTSALTNESRILFNRNINAMVGRIAPFLLFDSDPYPVVHRGRIVWMMDGYVASSRFPYSRPVTARIGGREMRVNYLRNSVKVTVDAYDGTVRFYAMDDPSIVPYRRIFGGLFSDISEMPRDLRDHLRYPKDLFEVQAYAMGIYHMEDPNTFYNREDLWQLTSEEARRPTGPNYVTVDLGEGAGREFVLMLPFMPAGRSNMVGWMAARCDRDRYGQLLVYKYPKRSLLFGPTQVEALIDQNPEISAQLSLWSQRGSDVFRGDLLVLPMGRSILYVQPIYLKAETGDLPELKRVVLSSGGDVAWGETLEEAADRLLGPAKTKAKTKAPEPPAGPSGGEGDLSQLVERALGALERGREALKDYDFAAYGRAMAELEEVMRTMRERMAGGDVP